MHVLPGNAGLHLSARIERAMAQVIVECARRGALPLSTYSINTTRQHGLVIGYGCVKIDQITSAVRALGVAIRAANRRR